jgi:hypothetical protein
MKHKRDFLSILIPGFFVVFTCLSCYAGQTESPKQSPAKQTTSVAAVKTDQAKSKVQSSTKIVVYYFHGNARCPTCFKLENYAKSEIETDFANAIKKGELEWKTVNVEEPGNEHFNDDYKLYTKSVIVSTVKDGKEVSWKNLDQIWQIIHEETKYREYIKNEVTACLAGKCL